MEQFYGSLNVGRGKNWTLHTELNRLDPTNLLTGYTRNRYFTLNTFTIQRILEMSSIVFQWLFNGVKKNGTFLREVMERGPLFSPGMLSVVYPSHFHGCNHTGKKNENGKTIHELTTCSFWLTPPRSTYAAVRHFQPTLPAPPLHIKLSSIKGAKWLKHQVSL